MNEDLKNNIKTLESRLERLRLKKIALNKTFKNDAPNNSDNKKLFEQGSNLKYLIYKFDKEVFDFVEPSVGKNNDISIPYTNLTGGVNSCNLYLNKHIEQIKTTLQYLYNNLRRYE